MKAVLEGLLFLVGEDGIDLETICNVLEIDKEQGSKLIEELSNDYQSKERGIIIKKFGHLYKLTTKKEHKEYYNKLADLPNIRNLSQSSLETLAIIAYNEPITRVEVDELRGVNSSQIIRNLVAKDFIKVVGKSDKLGRPNLYGITDEFLDYFGLESKKDLPSIEEMNFDKDDIDLYDTRYKEEIEEL
ncbi:MAG: SMC-Scp complex subunit ScpB [Bacilli bacterium]|nr:SMC-Scp complex subunit ScpB [Bacilli bacterium]